MLIRQRTRTDCAICAIAMALGLAYEEVMERALSLKDAYDPEQGMRAEYSVIESFGLQQMRDFRVMYRGVLSTEFFRHFSWGRRAILAVPSLNTEGKFHSVYWNGEQVLDPCDLKTYTEWKQLHPDELILFAERRA
jgi:hypothetical protein